MPNYKWAGHRSPSGTAYSVPAQIVGEEFTRLQGEHGSLTKQLVLNAATPTDSPLHAAFEWDDTVAAHGFRLTQAHSLIRSIRVVIESAAADGEQETAPAFIHVQDESDADTYDNKGRYEPIATVLADGALYAQIVRRALSDLENFQARYSQFTRLAAIWQRTHAELQRELEATISDSAAVPM